ncbi:MAG: hypothetical protein ACFFCW_44525 [Candidatus Hodarchaeota archaeon]
MICFDLGHLKKAKTHIDQAIKLSQNNDEAHIEGLSRTFLGRIMEKINSSEIKTAENCILRGIDTLEKLGTKSLCSNGYFYLGELYADTGQRAKALENLKKAESNFQEMGMNYWLARTYAVYADLHRKEGGQSRAKEQLEKAIGILRDLSADGWVKKYEKELAQIS